MSNRIKLSLNCRRIPTVTDNLSFMHECLKEFFAKLPEPWRVELSGSPNAEAGDLVAVCKVSRKGKFSGEVCYPIRNNEYLRNEAQFDDTLNLDFSANEDELRYFANDIFPELVSCFRSYRAEVSTKELARSDWLKIVLHTREAGSDIYGRCGVYRVWPLSYYSATILNKIPTSLSFEPFGSGFMSRNIEHYLNNSVESYGKIEVNS